MIIRYGTRRARWAAAERRAQAEREAGIPDRRDDDLRRPCTLDLSGAGGPVLVLEPRRGYHAWRARDADTGRLVACAAIKTLLHRVADQMPRQLAPNTAARC